MSKAHGSDGAWERRAREMRKEVERKAKEREELANAYRKTPIERARSAQDAKVPIDREEELLSNLEVVPARGRKTVPLSGVQPDLSQQSESVAPPHIVINYGQLLQYELEQLSWTHEELAKKIGVDVSEVQRWVTNLSSPDLTYRQKLAELLGNDYSLSSKVLDNGELQVSIVQFELTAQDFSSIISALTKLYTQSWLIQQGRYEDMIVYTNIQDSHFAREANIVISNLSYNSPALITIIADPHFVTTAVTTIVTLAVALQKVIDVIAESRHKLKKTDQDLEKEQIDIDLKTLELVKKRMDYTFEIARHHVNELCSACDPQEKATMIQALLPNISELVGKK